MACTSVPRNCVLYIIFFAGNISFLVKYVVLYQALYIAYLLLLLRNHVLSHFYCFC